MRTGIFLGGYCVFLLFKFNDITFCLSSIRNIQDTLTVGTLATLNNYGFLRELCLRLCSPKLKQICVISRDNTSIEK